MERPLKNEQFLLNLLGQKVCIFPIAKGEAVEKGDLVVVNTRTLQVCKAKKEAGYYAIGCVARIVTDEHGVKSAICKDGVYVINNTELPEHKILSNDIGRVCYFNGSNSVTLDNINTTKAGEVLNVCEDGRVLVKISLGEGSGLEW